MSKPRKSLSKKIRFEVFKRDSFTCQYCGQSAPDVALEVDHIDPVSAGGSNDILNLITSCKKCNAGKSNRLLSDDAIIRQRKEQLDELNERREQLEMMMEWQRGLLDLDTLAVTQLTDLWNDLVPGYSLNERGTQRLRKRTRKYELLELIEAMKASATQYLEYERDEEGLIDAPTQESVEKAWNYVERIIQSKRKMAEKPYLKRLYYCRGILRNRLSYLNEWKSIQLMEKAHLAGYSLDDIEAYTKETRNWSNFRDTMEEWAEANGGS